MRRIWREKTSDACGRQKSEGNKIAWQREAASERLYRQQLRHCQACVAHRRCALVYIFFLLPCLLFFASRRALISSCRRARDLSDSKIDHTP